MGCRGLWDQSWCRSVMMRLVWCALALCLVGVASDGSKAMGNRHRRAAGIYLSITGEKPQDKDNVNAGPLLPVQLPIKLGGEGGVTLPVLVLPVPVFTKAPDTCDANHNHNQAQINVNYQQAPAPPQPQPPYVAVRQQFTDASSSVQQPANFNFNVQVSAPPLDTAIPYSAVLNPNPVFQTSSEIMQSFMRQVPQAPELPAVIPDLSILGRVPAIPTPQPVTARPIQATTPPRPRFDRSLQLRIDLNVPRAGYTEAFQTEWHADSRTSRMVVEDGGTTFYQAPLADGRVQFLEVRVDRTGEKDVKRCTLSPLMPPSAMDLSFPGLPDPEQFEFSGYTTAEGQTQVERWERVVVGGPGEGGASAGESLTFRHELLVTRSNSGASIPLRYTVVTDSSILGPASDSYTQRYRVLNEPTDTVLPNTKKECDVFDDMVEPPPDDKHAFAEITARFKPLLEFSLPMRDTRYDFTLKTYKIDFQRNYIDLSEEAVRKNVLTQNSRFVAAANRLASTFEVGLNFLADRLDEELDLLLGVQQPEDGADEPGLIPFPYSNNEVRDISNKLPDEFDWRPLGAVSPVRFQGGSCASCWAFAVAGATEGALFKKTKRLVPLSAQCLVDCGGPFGCHGCNVIGTWPSFPYDYVQARGLPAWDEYTDYQAKDLQCKDTSVSPVTHISGHVNVTSYSLPALKVAIKKHGPNVIIMDSKAKSLVLYKKGVYKDYRCGQNQPPLNHAVLGVGWGNKGGSHIIIKNTWSDKWGEGGYILMDPDSCAVLARPSYPLITEPNIDREDLRAAAASVASAGEDQD